MIIAIIALSIISLAEAVALIVIINKGVPSIAPTSRSCGATAASEAKSEDVEEARRRVEEELKAFQELMSYSADKAYGIYKE